MPPRRAGWAFSNGNDPDATELNDNPSDLQKSFCIELYSRSFNQSRARNDSARSSLRLGVENQFKWQNGRTLTVCFLGYPSEYLKRRVKEIAPQWMRYANIKFHFVEGQRADIRIKFTGLNGNSSSYVGSDNLNISPHEETMELGLVDSSSEALIRRTVLHEFGHALGCVHEHSQPNFPFHWNEQVVIDAHRGIWDAQTVRDNIFEKYNHQQVTASSFDRRSIMLYHFPQNGRERGMGPRRTQIFPRRISSSYRQSTRSLPSLPTLILLILHDLLALLVLRHQIYAVTLIVEKHIYARPITTGS
ncbi:hypothetical protein BJV74DRAFT_298794 [Russula compacta]|nr:hypothetical protein BJV74DRAFT_298794 [Russula compacta]